MMARDNKTIYFICGVCFLGLLLYNCRNNLLSTSVKKSELRGAFSQTRRIVEKEQSFQPMVIKTFTDHSYDYKSEMKKLNEAKVAIDDPRLINLIRDYYLIAPSTEPYNLTLPNKLEYSMGQTPFVDSRLNYMEGGFYVECGAFDGERSSNTLFFEKVRKWNGLLIEADPTTFQHLKAKHRKAFIINACLNTEPYPTVVKFNRGDQRGRVAETGEAMNWIRQQRMRKQEVEVQCFPLYSILLALNQTTIDFFSLDVEGDELKVLKTIPYDKLDIKMMTVEYKHDAAGLRGVKRYVESKGYTAMLQLAEFHGMAEDVIFRKNGLSHNDVK